MKRPFANTPSSVKTGVDILEVITQEQLAGIGAVALAYNYAENSINRMIAPSIGVRTADMYEHVSSRINGIDGKIAIIKQGAEEMDVSAEIRTFLAESLGESAFGLFKKYRDAIIHARILNTDLGIGELIERRGQRSEILLTVDALRGLYEHINVLRLELAGLLMILMVYMEMSRAEPDDPNTKQREAKIQVYFALAQKHRTRRLSLPPIPGFPSESELSERESRRKQTEPEGLEVWHQKAPPRRKG